MVTEPAEVEDAYLAIADYFNCEGYREGIRLLNKLLETAMSERTTKENPASVLFFVKALKRLTAAVVLIQKTGHKWNAAMLVPPDDGYPDLSRLADFSLHHCIPLWETFPRMLSEKEYFNPYIVFKKVSRFGDAGEWAYILDEVFDYCFTRAASLKTQKGIMW